MKLSCVPRSSPYSVDRSSYAVVYTMFFCCHVQLCIRNGYVAVQDSVMYLFINSNSEDVVGVLCI